MPQALSRTSPANSSSRSKPLALVRQPVCERFNKAAARETRRGRWAYSVSSRRLRIRCACHSEGTYRWLRISAGQLQQPAPTKRSTTRVSTVAMPATSRPETFVTTGAPQFARCWKPPTLTPHCFQAGRGALLGEQRRFELLRIAPTPPSGPPSKYSSHTDSSRLRLPLPPCRESTNFGHGIGRADRLSRIKCPLTIAAYPVLTVGLLGVQFTTSPFRISQHVP